MNTFTLRTNYDPSQFVDAHQISLTRVGAIDVSTVRLAKFQGEVDRYETCLFHDNGNSHVVASYDDRLEAIFYHSRIVDSLRFALDGGASMYDDLGEDE